MTQIIFLAKLLKALSEIKDCLDGSWNIAEPSMAITTKQFCKALKEIVNKIECSCLNSNAIRDA